MFARCIAQHFPVLSAECKGAEAGFSGLSASLGYDVLRRHVTCLSVDPCTRSKAVDVDDRLGESLRSFLRQNGLCCRGSHHAELGGGHAHCRTTQKAAAVRIDLS